MAEHIFDFAASRRSQSRIAANVTTAMNEAAQMSDRAHGALMQAQLSALAGFDTSEAIAKAHAECMALAKQLQFAAALAERAEARAARISA